MRSGRRERVVCNKRFFGGFLVGVLFGLIVCYTNECMDLKSRVYSVFGIINDQVTQRLDDGKLHEAIPSTGSVNSNRKSLPENAQELHEDDTRVADQLAGQVRILCWVMTQPKNLETRASHIKATWGQRCDNLLFFSSVTNETFPTIGVNTTEGRDQLTKKTMRAFQYVHDHYLNDYDWFMRTDDDTYVVMENLRYLLSEQDPNGNLYFGRHFRTLVPGGFFSGGPGIILGKEALRRLGKHMNDSRLCPQEKGPEDDVIIGFCMNNLGIFPGNTTDRLGKSRFHCLKLSDHMQGNYPGWFLNYDTNWAKWGMSSLSRHPVGFHYVDRDQFYEIEYFLYNAKPYGFNLVDQDVNLPRNRSKAQLPI